VLLPLSPDLLPESVPAGQAVPRPQDPVLRRRALPLLCPHRGGQAWVSSRRLLLQGTNHKFKNDYWTFPDCHSYSFIMVHCLFHIQKNIANFSGDNVTY